MSNTPTDQPGPRLVLFDIDGTLMITKGASSRCMKRAGEIVFGPTFEWHGLTAGTLDQQIFAKLAKDNGITPSPEEALRYEEAYLNELEKELTERQHDIVVMPGIEALVEHLHRRALDCGDVMLGVLTGNFRRATEVKLTQSGLGLERFTVIACAEDGNTRDELPKVALQRAAVHAGRPVQPADTYILGDTPRDIQCARANDCVCISVATGRYAVDQLSEAGGDNVFESFADVAAVLDAMGLGS